MDTNLAQALKHDGGDLEPAPFRVVAAWPAPAFVENLAVASDGAIFLTVH
jgi:hypothetical protein